VPTLLIECQRVVVLSVRREAAYFEFEALSSVRCFFIAASEQENVQYISVKDGVGSVKLVIVRLDRKVFLPLSLKEMLVNNLESLLFFHLFKSSLFDQIRD
jgi:hypothetical protein